MSEPTTKVETEEFVDEATDKAEEPLPAFPHREKGLSDLGGMDTIDEGSPRTRPNRGDRRAVSDLVILMNLPEEAQAQGGRKRQKSSADVVTTFFTSALNQDDLRMAEEVAVHGTRAERLAQGITDSAHEKKIEEFEEKEFEDGAADFVFNHEGLTSAEAAERLIKYGRNELPETRDPKWLIFLRQFWAPMPIMIWIAIIIEISIKNILDTAILCVIQFANGFISFYETTKAGDAVAALKSSLKPTATCKRDGKWAVIDGGSIVPGDTVLLASGSAIPADCRVNNSEIDVDQAALTGESLPVTFYKGDSCKMGSTVVRGEVEGTVEFTGADTFFGKTASLLKNTHELSHLQIILMKIMFVLVGLSLTCVIIVFIYLIKKGETTKEALSFTVVLLVASIPLAIEIVTTTTLAIGSKDLVKHGAIVAKLSAIEDLAGMSILCSDKTGTLTLNTMVLQDDTPIYYEGENQESVLVYAAMAAKWKEPARDALDRLTLGSVNMPLLDDYEQLDYLPFDPQIKRTEGTVKNTKTGEEFKTTKGAPHVIMKLLDSSETATLEAVEKDVARLGECGIRSLAVGRTFNGVWKMIGLLTFLDPPRPDTKQTISDAHHYGIQVKMITGDHLLIARNTAAQLEMGDRIFTSERLPMLDPETKEKPANLGKNYGDLCLAADGFAQVYPEHKYLIVECLRELHYTVGMTGDGVNDAPALKRADIGIAVAGATDAARAAADIVLTEPGLGTIIHGILIAREIFTRMSNFITYRIAATLQLLFFFFIAIFAFHPADFAPAEADIMVGQEWPAFFKMPVIMLMLITLLNDGTLISIAYDYATASTTPNRWNLPAIFLTSSTLGAVSCGSSLLLLSFLLNSWDPKGFFAAVGMNPLQYGQVTTAIYLKVSVSDFLTLFSSRTGRDYFWSVKPAPMLFGGCCFALGLSSILALFWPTGEIDGVAVEGLSHNVGLFFFVWLYSLVFWFLQDFLKVMAFKWMYWKDFNKISSTGVVIMPESALKMITELDKAMKEGVPAHH